MVIRRSEIKSALTFLQIAGGANGAGQRGSNPGGASDDMHWDWIALAIVCLAISGWLRVLAQRTIRKATAYAVWTLVGAVGTFLIGIARFGSLRRFRVCG